MAYDERLAGAIRRIVVATGEEANERKMFGGLAFLINGNMAIVASREGGVMVRVNPEDSDMLVSTSHATVAEMRGRPMRGWLLVAPEHLQTHDTLEHWVHLGIARARSLPAK